MDLSCTRMAPPRIPPVLVTNWLRKEINFAPPLPIATAPPPCAASFVINISSDEVKVARLYRPTAPPSYALLEKYLLSVDITQDSFFTEMAPPQ